MVYTIARDTGWSEDFIIWQMPLARSLQYYHCALQNANLWTLEPATEKTIAELVPEDFVNFVAGLDDEEENEAPAMPPS